MPSHATPGQAQSAPAALPDGPIALKEPNDAFYATWCLLESVTDPEIPVVNLREMGILRAVRQTATGLEVVITPTYSGCPAMSQMQDDVVNALAKAGVAARVLTQIAPAWSTDWMTPEGREKLRAYGIAPPHPSGCGTPAANVIQFASKKTAGGAELSVACPQCGSDNTTETSHFGSTACKALYRCLNCLEPFDYFKPY
ncbi:1,2-phenylacetyl-CoA epoxidase subunit PaaD [Rhodoferax sp.]|uniref:1,2-phenylacetyl-CoA epoxidase subunit PaaD n=1 Tax=Rhodoferax sp. TaxID=50421 RepID=UPI002724BEC5|nr:1,2-phenylacetyl-CoA epoxidase subunit PaaD [Rhodoferax sp.]MDO8319153.1 1,2-phenylacetyl-CoA epoxidase subunit PaaD [Rhodoferax sp.]